MHCKRSLCSDLVALNTSLELDLPEPVVVGCLCLVPSVAVEQRRTAKIGVDWLV